MTEGDFTLDGTWLGRPIRLRFRHGHLFGPAGFVDLVRFHSWLRANGMGPVPASGRDATSDSSTLDLSVALLDHVDRILTQEGDATVIALPA